MENIKNGGYLNNELGFFDIFFKFKNLLLSEVFKFQNIMDAFYFLREIVKLQNLKMIISSNVDFSLFFERF